MIYFRKLIEGDLEKVNKLLKEENINDRDTDGIIYVVIEDEEVRGIGKVKEKDYKWFLEYLVIKKEMRGKRLGDGLLRVLSNMLLKKGVVRLYCRQENDFLIKKGFNKKDDNYFELNIEELFEHKCDACGGINEF
ncbi:MAG: GNAT family N-acetyltransferase [Tissierellia bacterium]|nr:GNAT family N-acetyltransferase [Tissierellia bacterium]